MTLWASNSLPRYITKRSESKVCQTTFVPEWSSSSIHNTQKVKQLKRPLTDEWTNKVWQSRTMGYGSASKRKSTETRYTQMNPENIMLRRQSQKTWFDLYAMFRIGTSIETESRYFTHVRFPFGRMKGFWNWIEVVVAQHWEYTKCTWIVHFKMFSFMLRTFT